MAVGAARVPVIEDCLRTKDGFRARVEDIDASALRVWKAVCGVVVGIREECGVQQRRCYRGERIVIDRFVMDTVTV